MDQGNKLSNNTPKKGGSAPRPSIDNFITQPRQTQQNPQVNNDDMSQQQPAHSGSMFPANSNSKKPENGKGTKTWLIIFAILFIAATATAGYCYMKYSDVNSELSSYKQENTTQAGQITELQKSSEKVAGLQKTVDSQKTFIDSLTAVTNELKTTCGTKCDSITIPIYTEDSE